MTNGSPSWSARKTSIKGMVTAIRDIYDALPPERGTALRRANLERLAELEADGAERRARMESAADAPTRPAGPAT
jgi:hypothetical protein